MPEEKILKRLQILVVDDFIVNQQITKIMLHNLGYDSTIAENGLIAVELFKTGTFDLILMDLQMPVMDGTQASMYIRCYEKENNLPAIPIIALTAQVLNDERAYCLRIGINDFIAKPVGKEELKEKIENLISQKKA